MSLFEHFRANSGLPSSAAQFFSTLSFSFVMICARIFVMGEL
jgi:hypothetical protein